MRYLKKYISTILLAAVFLTGSGLLLYPAISDWWNAWHQSRAIASYEAGVERLKQEDYSGLFEAAEEYNRNLLTDNRRFHPDAEQTRYYHTLLLTGNSDVIATVEIPSIKVKLPVYHSTEEAVLQNGIGHIEGSSLPIGGESTHCVLSGHRGLPSARLFTDLNQVIIGDRFYIHVLGKTLTYETDQITVVEPQEMEDVEIIAGEDYCTLVTCTPYGINSHRLLVRGKRVAGDGKSLDSQTSVSNGTGADSTNAGAASDAASVGAAPDTDAASTTAGAASGVTRDWKTRLKQELTRWFPAIAAGLLFAVFLLILAMPVIQKRRKRGKDNHSNPEKKQGGDKR
ncbi:class C sortase [Clostridium sp. AN503]|uniref:class C sortase n=1 Tax=Clostridium sp. AN503 TaxID=3160598 RepID=UPI00345A80B1